MYSPVVLSSEPAWDTRTLHSMMPKRYLPLLHTLMLTLIHTKSIRIQPSIIGYIAKSVALVGKGEKYDGYRACDIAFERFHSTHVSFLLLIKVCNPCTPSWLSLTCSYCLGRHRIYGRRPRRCDIARRRPHRYGALQLDMLCGSGACITRYHATNIADIPSRLICFFTLEACIWSAATTSLRYNISSVHKPKCDAMRVNRSSWSRW